MQNLDWGTLDKAYKVAGCFLCLISPKLNRLITTYRVNWRCSNYYLKLLININI